MYYEINKRLDDDYSYRLSFKRPVKASPARALPCTGERTVAGVQRLLADGVRIDSTGDACTTCDSQEKQATKLSLLL